MLVCRPQNPSKYYKKKKQSAEQGAAVFVDVRPFWMGNLVGRKDNFCWIANGRVWIKSCLQSNLLIDFAYVP